MIQVCSRCGTRWNVRDRQRVWCPRCNGTLLAPSASRHRRRSGRTSDRTGRCARAVKRPSPRGCRRDTAGSRFGPVPRRPPRRRRRESGPHPALCGDPALGSRRAIRHRRLEQQAEPRRGPSIAALRTTLVATIAVLGLAALVHVVRYALLIINRSVLLNPVVAWLATWLGVLVSVAALFLVFASVVLLTNWLIARRSAAFKHVGRQEHRPLWALRAGCLVPLVEFGMGAGLRPRTGQRRGRSRPSSPADRGVVGGVGASAPRCRCSPSRPASPPTPRASPTTR